MSSDHNTKVMTSSEFMDWETPQEFVDALPFKFTKDVCATFNNAKAELWITPTKGSLSSDVRWDDVWWCNPPYGRGIGKWIEKGINESERNGSLGVFLVPNRTETKWFNLLWLHADVIVFLGKRIHFQHPDPEKENNGAPFANVLAVVGTNEGAKYAEELSKLGTTLVMGYGNVWTYKGGK